MKKTKNRTVMLQIGDKVEVLDDVILGEVIAIDGQRITIADDEGFPMEFDERELVKSQDMRIGQSDMAKALREKKSGLGKKNRKPVRKKQDERVMEVDLHIHELVSSTEKLTNFDMLNIQLARAQKQLDFAIRKHIPRMVFIHGVGEGVLRAELETLFRRYDQVVFYDADYGKYGRGATEVKILQNF